MSRVDCNVFTPEDYAVIRRFTGILANDEIKAVLTQLELGSYENATEIHLRPLFEHLRLVLRTEPQEMFKEAVSFAYLCEMVVDLEDLVPGDFVPTDELVDKLLEQYWNRQRDVADSHIQDSVPALGNTQL